MGDYIDQDAVFHAMKMDIRPPFAVVRDFPAADVAPVVHGKWKIARAGRTIKCSNCGRIFDRFVNGAQLPEHCFCGAKMDKEVTNNA